MKKISKRFLALAITCVMAMMMAVPAFAAGNDTPTVTNALISVPTKTKVHITSKMFPAAYLNVETTSDAKEDDTVGVWQNTGHDSQRWYIVKVDASSNLYYVCNYKVQELALNIYRSTDATADSAVLPCTVYPWRGNNQNDCQIKIVDESSNPIVSNDFGFVLPTYVKCMTVTGGSNGNDVKWQKPNSLNSQIWDITRG